VDHKGTYWQNDKLTAYRARDIEQRQVDAVNQALAEAGRSSTP